MSGPTAAALRSGPSPTLGRPALDPARARRIDRLARGAHLFHRHAHHPLCAAYAGEVIGLGRRTRLCRGCTSAVAGAALGVAFSVVAPLPDPIVAAALLVAALVSAACLGPSGRHRDAPRRSKLLTRALPCAVLLAVLVSGLRARSLAGAGAAALALTLLVAASLAYRRRGPDRSACARCPEHAAGRVCSGFRPIARREAAFARAAARILRG